MNMTRQQFSFFMQLQARTIMIHKWIESEKAGHDLGSDACHDWINKYSKTFRDEFEEKIKRGEIK